MASKALAATFRSAFFEWSMDGPLLEAAAPLADFALRLAVRPAVRNSTNVTHNDRFAYIGLIKPPHSSLTELCVDSFIWLLARG
jgi:hypothetical protein